MSDRPWPWPLIKKLPTLRRPTLTCVCTGDNYSAAPNIDHSQVGHPSDTCHTMRRGCSLLPERPALACMPSACRSLLTADGLEVQMSTPQTLPGTEPSTPHLAQQMSKPYLLLLWPPLPPCPPLPPRDRRSMCATTSPPGWTSWRRTSDLTVRLSWCPC